MRTIVTYGRRANCKKSELTNKEKAVGILAIIMDELNMPKGASIGDVGWALASIDESDEIIRILKRHIRMAVIDDIHAALANRKDQE